LKLAEMWLSLLLSWFLFGRYSWAAGNPDNIALSMPQLHLKPRPGEDAMLILGNGDKSYTIEVTGKGDFQILYQNNQIFSASPSNGVSVTSLTSKFVNAQELILNGIPQWKMEAFETFDSPPPSSTPAKGALQYGQCTKCLKSGWNNDQTIQCSFLDILSLENVNYTLTKTFSHLSNHDQLRITATAHFIDDWQGQTAFLKVDNNYIWTETVDQTNGAGRINVCGSSTYPETRFSVPIDITIPHRASQVTVQFGALLEKGSEETHFGISSLTLYSRLQNYLSKNP